MRSRKSIPGDIQPALDFSPPAPPERLSAAGRPAPCADAAAEGAAASELTLADMRQAVLGWIATLNPTSAGVLVPTRVAKFQADVAAFWSAPRRRKGKKILEPVRTAIVEVRLRREDCWPDCSGKEELFERLREAKERLREIESGIRAAEPYLRSDDNLFPEIECWNYHLTSNPRFHACRRKIEELERAIYNGSRLERVRSALLADHLYLAVPRGEVHPHEVADGWALLHIAPDRTVSLASQPYDWECPMENRLHLVQKIAAANFRHLLFAKGVDIESGKGRPVFLRPPFKRKRRLS